MANALYNKGKQAILGNIDLSADDIRVMLVDTGTYTYSATHQYVASPGPATGSVARSTALASKTLTDGTFDAADITINSVTGLTVEAVVVYKYNAADASAEVIAYIDASPAIAFTPNGSNVTVTFDALGIFSI